ncbi:MAG: hypothetical protein H7839_16320 [Magnetococcus sp. YQC-5]
MNTNLIADNLLKFEIGKSAFDKDNLVGHQKNAYDYIIDTIKKILEANKKIDFKNKSEEFVLGQATHVLSIFGNRGDGKTATLVTICQKLSKDRKILMVPILEPELLRFEEELFLSIAFSLYQLLEKQEKIKDNACPLPAYSKLKQGLNELVANFLSRSTSNHNLILELSGSIEGFTQRFMQHGSSILSSTQRFRHWIDELLNVTGCELLVLPVDDLDLCVDMSAKVLEAIRIYLCNPRVVVLMTANSRHLRRSILNAQLKQLPNFFIANEFHNSQNEFYKVVKDSHATLVANEYNKELEHAKQFINKIIPPAYRFYMHGLRPDERQTTQFCLLANGSHISFESLWDDVILLRDIIDRYQSTKNDQDKFSADVLKDTINFLLYNPRKRAAPHIKKIVKNYFMVPLISVRVLLNQIYKFYYFIQDWRKELKYIAEHPLSDSDKNNIKEYFYNKRNTPKWSSMLLQPDEDGVDEETRLKILMIVKVEEKYFVDFFRALSINPDIQVDMQLFDSNEKMNAFGSQTLSEFWGIIINNRYTVSSNGQYWFQCKTKDGNELSDASSALLHVMMEHGAAISTPSDVLQYFGLDVNENPKFKIRKIAMLDFVNSKKSKIRRYDIEDLIIDNLTFMNFAPDVQNKQNYIINFKPLYASVASAFRTIQEIHNYRYQTQSYHDVIQEKIDALNHFYDDLYGVLRNRRDADKGNDQSIKYVQSTHGLELNRNLNDHFLSVCCLVMIYEIWRLSSAFLNDSSSLVTFSQTESTLLWKITRVKNLGKNIVDLLTLDENKLEIRLFILLYLANLPLAPLLTAWNYEKSDMPQSIILAILNLVEALAKDINDYDYESTIEFCEQNNIYMNKCMHTVSISPIEATIVRFFRKKKMNAMGVESMTRNIVKFLDLLIEIQVGTAENETHYISHEFSPAAWKRAIDIVVNQDVNLPTFQFLNLSTFQHLNPSTSQKLYCLNR